MYEDSPHTLNKYSDNLEVSLKNEDGTWIEPSCIYNYDETNLTDDPDCYRAFLICRSQPAMAQSSNAGSKGVLEVLEDFWSRGMTALKTPDQKALIREAAAATQLTVTQVEVSVNFVVAVLDFSLRSIMRIMKCECEPDFDAIDHLEFGVEYSTDMMLHNFVC